MFFDNMENVAKLKQECNEWLGTPYRHLCGVKGQGVDCIHFVLCVMENIGAVPKGRIRVPHYDSGWHMVNRKELLLKGLRESGVVIEAVGRPKSGDILLYKFGYCCSHSGILCGGRVYQALNGMGVRGLALNDPRWAKRHRYTFRVI